MTRLVLVSLALTLGLALVIVELVRRRRLHERYSLLWFVTAIVTVLFAAWPSALGRLASAVGIAYPPSALFFVAGLFGLALLLHFSVAISRLTDECKRLAQHVALLENEVAELRPSTPSITALVVPAPSAVTAEADTGSPETVESAHR